MDREEYVEAVLSLVEQVPSGRVTTYGALAEAVGVAGPRQVGTVMSGYGGPVPWWRVVHADGSPPTCHDGEAHRHHVAEGTPLRPSGKVDMRQAFWPPPRGQVLPLERAEISAEREIGDVSRGSF